PHPHSVRQHPSDRRTAGGDGIVNSYKCPKCNATDEETTFRVIATALFDVSGWGTEDYENVEWTNDSPMWCGLCKHDGIVADFSTDTEATA
ncbi:MAG: hypothetical protein ACO3GP_08380, partial [Candidatus Limnocylindrus sp.]